MADQQVYQENSRKQNKGSSPLLPLLHKKGIGENMKEVKTLSRNMFQSHFGMFDSKVLRLSPDFEKCIFRRFQNYREISVDELEELSKSFISHSNYSNMLKEQYEGIGGITDKEVLKHAMSEILHYCCVVTFVD